MKSSSIHNLNADKGLGFTKKIMYLFFNWINNLLPYRKLDPRIKFKDFKPDWQSLWCKTYKTSSAARKASDLFWYSLPWDKIELAIGKAHIFDTGCGHGNYGARLYESSEGRIASYTGVDAKRRPNWDVLSEKYPNFKFIESSSSDIKSLIPSRTNLFITQSAIEHFDEDLRFFEQIRDYTVSSNLPVLQIHLFPAASTLPLYLFHGVRQYTPRTISKITNIFEGNCKFYLFGLGGDKGKHVHFKYFTWPVLIARKYAKPTFNEEEYDKALSEAFVHDFAHPSPSPIFWALVIQSNFKEDIW